MSRWQWMIGGTVITAGLLVLGGTALGTHVALAAIEGEVAQRDSTQPAHPPPALPADLPAEVRPCADCHLNPGLPVSYREGSGRLHEGFIDPTAYMSSVHFRAGERACSDCHRGDYSHVPHPAGNPEPSCSSCHGDRQGEFQGISAAAHRSVHYAAGVGVDFDCGTCHSPHTMHAGQEMTVAEKNAACIDCHEKRFNPTGLTLAQRHAWHPQAALHLNRIACIDCHTQPSGSDNSFRHDILPAAQATSDCYACHGANTKMAAYVGNFEGRSTRSSARGQLVREYYISGGTSSALLDRSGLVLMLLVALGTATHGLARYIRRRRRPS